jgi:CBS domain-containing protein
LSTRHDSSKGRQSQSPTDGDTSPCICSTSTLIQSSKRSRFYSSLPFSQFRRSPETTKDRGYIIFGFSMMMTRRFFLLMAAFGSLWLPSVTPFSADPGRRVFVSTPSKQTKRLVSDCMTPRPEMHTLAPTASVDEAISLLLVNGISGAPVVDPDSGKLVGIISSSDFMFKDYAGALLNMEGSSEHVEGFVQVAKKIVGTSVQDLMTTKVATIHMNEPMAHAAETMGRNKLHRLLVVDPEDEKLVGILTRSDVMRDVMTSVRAALPEHASFAEGEEDASKFKP